MGILKCNTKNKRLEFDDIFKWCINPEWTLQEAAKLPIAYSMVKIYFYSLLIKFLIYFINKIKKTLQAYYCLVVKARVESGNSVLIHDGCSQDGQAFIRVALSFNCKVYVTAYNKDQSNFLKCLFPKVVNCTNDIVSKIRAPVQYRNQVKCTISYDN